MKNFNRYSLVLLFMMAMVFYSGFAAANLRAGFNADLRSGCAPVIVQFTDQSDGNPDTWLWDMGNGTRSSLRHPSVTYFTPGVYSVKLIIQNTAGADSLIREQFIEVYAAPVVNFSAGNTEVCRNTVIMFTELVAPGSDALSSLEWDFGDGTIGSGSSPGHAYAAPGQYSVMLKATSNFGCVTTQRKTGYIKVQAVYAAFSSSVAGACSATSISFLATGSAGSQLNWHWNMGDSSYAEGQQVNHIYQKGGQYKVELVVTNSLQCRDSVSKLLKISDNPKAIFSSDRRQVCALPGMVRFNTAALYNCTYAWDFGAAGRSTIQSPTVVFRDTGRYSVKLVVKNQFGCGDSLFIPGFIQVNRTDIRLAGLPDSGCAGLNKRMSALVRSNDSVRSWQWSFGDGQVATQASPEHRYDVPGDYRVSLTVSTVNGCVDSLVMPAAIGIRDKPQADFSADRHMVCGNEMVGFSNHTSGLASSWLWDFGDQELSFDQQPVHQFNDTGWMTITLIANNRGCSDTVTRESVLYVKPAVARFYIEQNCFNRKEVTFVNLSAGAQRWEWDFGDGNRSTDISPRHTYQAEGSYQVSLQVWNDSTGCHQLKIKKLQISSEKPWVRTLRNTACLGDTTIFTSGTTGNGIALYAWHFGDDSVRLTSSGKAAYRYPAPGVYQVKLITLDSFNCRDTALLATPLRVIKATAAFEPANYRSCAGDIVEFTDLSAVSGGSTIQSWKWDFGNGQTQACTAPPFTYRYLRGGEYKPSLVIYSPEGCTDTFAIADPLKVKDIRLTAMLIDTLVCPGYPARMQTPYFETGAEFTWDFGDGLSGTGQKASHRYSREGLFNVQLIVVSPEGCRDTAVISRPIQVKATSARFSISDTFRVCPPLLARFTNQSFAPLGSYWNFGDSSSTSENNPDHYYTYPGNYQAMLVAYGPAGCNDTARQRIRVNGPSGILIYPSAKKCRPYSYEFNVQANNADAYIWDMDNGLTLPNRDTVLRYTYPDPGKFLPRIILIDSAGCRVPVSGRDTLFNIDIQASFRLADTVFCAGSDIRLINVSQHNDTQAGYEWDMGDGSLLTAESPSYQYQLPGEFHIRMKAVTVSGCIDTFRLARPVQVGETPVFTLSGDTSGCVPVTVQYKPMLANLLSDDVRWQWQWSNGELYNFMIPPTREFTEAGSYPFKVTAVLSNGCSYSLKDTTLVLPSPEVLISGSQSICLGHELRLEATGAATYEWDEDPALVSSGPGAVYAVVRPASSRSFRVKGYSTAGCTGWDSVYIPVHQPFKLQYTPEVTVCAGKSTILRVDGAAHYQWTPSNGLSNPSVPNPVVQPAESTRYQIAGADTAGCFSDTGYVTVTVAPLPTVHAGGDHHIVSGQTLTLEAVYSGDVTEVFWSPTDFVSRYSPGTILVKPTTTTAYSVEVRNGSGCSAIDRLTVYCNVARHRGQNRGSLKGSFLNV